MKLLLVYPLHTTFAITQHDNETYLTLLSNVEPGMERGFLTNLDESQTYELKEVVPQIVQEIKELEQNAPTEE